MVRCFAAVEVAAPSIRRFLESVQFGLQRDLRPHDPVKWVPPHQFHFTLKFFGEIEAAAAQAAGAALQGVAEQNSPFTLEIKGLGAFPDLSQSAVLWAGVGQGQAELAALAEQVEQAMEQQGFSRERRPFRPHLTLGRVRQGGRLSAQAVARLRETATSFGSWQVERLVLMQSELLPGGPRYSVLASAPLG